MIRRLKGRTLRFAPMVGHVALTVTDRHIFGGRARYNSPLELPRQDVHRHFNVARAAHILNGGFFEILCERTGRSQHAASAGRYPGAVPMWQRLFSSAHAAPHRARGH